MYLSISKIYLHIEAVPLNDGLQTYGQKKTGPFASLSFL